MSRVQRLVRNTLGSCCVFFMAIGLITILLPKEITPDWVKWSFEQMNRIGFHQKWTMFAPINRDEAFFSVILTYDDGQTLRLDYPNNSENVVQSAGACN